jgi:hypothetical protein
MDDMRRVTADKKRGIRWWLMDTLEDLEYADYLCLLVHRFSDMQENISKLEKESEIAGLRINIAKTKVIQVNPKTQKQLETGNQSNESVDFFTYLGSIVTREGGALEDVSNRIGKANSAFVQLYPVWKNSNISRKTKLRIFSSNVKTVLLYASETWKLNTIIRRKLQTFISRCLRKIINIHWPEKIRTEELLELAGEEPVETQIKRRKWRWIDHTLRKSDDAIEKQALNWNPLGARKLNLSMSPGNEHRSPQ